MNKCVFYLNATSSGKLFLVADQVILCGQEGPYLINGNSFCLINGNSFCAKHAKQTVFVGTQQGVFPLVSPLTHG